MINERYGELLQEIAKLMAEKHIIIEKLHAEIAELKKKLSAAEEQKGQ